MSFILFKNNEYFMGPYSFEHALRHSTSVLLVVFYPTYKSINSTFILVNRENMHG